MFQHRIGKKYVAIFSITMVVAWWYDLQKKRFSEIHQKIKWKVKQIDANMWTILHVFLIWRFFLFEIWLFVMNSDLISLCWYLVKNNALSQRQFGWIVQCNGRAFAVLFPRVWARFATSSGVFFATKCTANFCQSQKIH